jgi:hypothetical protein
MGVERLVVMSTGERGPKFGSCYDEYESTESLMNSVVQTDKECV